jgi:hypothetical protein
MRQLILIIAGLVCLALGAATPALAAGPAVTVVSPEPGDNLTTSDVQIVIQTSEFQIVPSMVPVSEASRHAEMNQPGQGHVHLSLDVQPLVIWTSDDPYVFHDVAYGPHLLRVELVNDDHSSLTPPVIQQVQFRTGPAALPNTGSAAPDTSAWLLMLAGAALALAGLYARRQSRMRVAQLPPRYPLATEKRACRQHEKTGAGDE